MGVKGNLLKLGKRNAKWSMVGPRWKIETKSVFLLFRCFKTYNNLWEREKKVIPIQ
jgi:hypothetical protein